MDVLYVKNCKSVYLCDGSVVKEVECGYKKGLVTSVLEFEHVLSYDFFLDSNEEKRVYEYLKCQSLIDEDTIFYFVSYPLNDKFLITSFIVKKDDLNKRFKEIVDVYKYIDYISLEPLIFRAYYRLYPAKGVDLFVVDRFSCLYKDGKFVLVREGVDFEYLRELGFEVDRVLVFGEKEGSIKIKESLDELRAIHNYYFRDFDVSIFHSPIPFYKKSWFRVFVVGVVIILVLIWDWWRAFEKLEAINKEYDKKELILKKELAKLNNLKKKLKLKEKKLKLLTYQKEILQKEYNEIESRVLSLIKIYKEPLFYNRLAIIDELLGKYHLKVKEFRKDKRRYELKIVSKSPVDVTNFLRALLKSGFRDVKFSFIKKEEKVYADVSFN
ncbi:MAG: hypothetical protein ABGX23_01910 [Nautiliaceae bacterium]